MQSGGGVRWVVSCVLLVANGCATPRIQYKARVDGVIAAHPRTDKQVPPPAALDAKPWRVGQWALYGDGASYEMITVVGLEPCGTWIEIDAVAYHARTRRTLCLHADDGALQLAIIETDDGPPAFFDLRTAPDRGTAQGLATDIARLVPPQWATEGLVREDVVVPAGRFASALRTNEPTGPRWTHPDVPFDATVKRGTSDGRVVELLAYGDEAGRDVLPELKAALAAARAPRRTPRMFIGFSTAAGYLTGSAADAGTSLATTGSVVGFRVSDEVDLVAEIVNGRPAYVAPAMTPLPVATLGGLRWSPWRLSHLSPHRLLGASALYVQATLGYVDLRSSSATATSVASGLALGATLGWLGAQQHDWAAGIELGDHVGVFDNGEGVRHALTLTMFVQLYLPLRW